MNKKIIRTITGVSILLGVILLFLAYMYWTTSAGDLPTFIPGYEPGVYAVHSKHAVAAFVLALGLFAYAWFESGRGKKRR